MIAAEALPRKSRLAALLDHFAAVEDPRDVRRIQHPLPEILLLVVCGTIADCDDYEDIAGWGAAHLDFLRRHLPYAHGVPGERWLTILMNRINPALFSAAFAAWVRESWPEKAGLVAIDGKTSRRSHDRRAGAEPLHLVSAFATTARLVLAQEAVPDQGSELAAIPLLLERLGADDGLVRSSPSTPSPPTPTSPAPSPPRRRTGSSRSRPTSRRFVPRSRPPSPRPWAERTPGSTPTPTSTRATAASRSVAPPSSARSTGSQAGAASRARCACRARPASCAPRPG